MNELIPLHSQTIDGSTVETVSARELYEALGLDKSNWSRWTKQNIVNNPFAVVNNDYVGFVIMTNGNETTDYALVTDVADVLEISNANPSRFNLDEAGVHKMYISYPSGVRHHDER